MQFHLRVSWLEENTLNLIPYMVNLRYQLVWLFSSPSVYSLHELQFFYMSSALCRVVFLQNGAMDADDACQFALLTE
jgi:hypothetical protein